MMNETIVWTLPCPSTHIVDGPEALLRPGTLILRYDTEDDGLRQLVFSGLAGMKFTGFDACGTEHLRAYDKLIELKSSELLTSLISDSRTDVTNVRHYRIFFDDVGCYDVLAEIFNG